MRCDAAREQVWSEFLFHGKFSPEGKSQESAMHRWRGSIRASRRVQRALRANAGTGSNRDSINCSA